MSTCMGVHRRGWRKAREGHGVPSPASTRCRLSWAPQDSEGRKSLVSAHPTPPPLPPKEYLKITAADTEREK